MTAQPPRLAREVLIRDSVLFCGFARASFRFDSRIGVDAARAGPWKALAAGSSASSGFGLHDGTAPEARKRGAHSGLVPLLWFCACKLPLRRQYRRRCGTRWAVRYPGGKRLRQDHRPAPALGSMTAQPQRLAREVLTADWFLFCGSARASFRFDSRIGVDAARA